MFVNDVMLHRIQQNIAWNGEMYEVYRRGVNEYKEKSETPVKLKEFTGIFHDGSANHQSVTISNSGYKINKTVPFILAKWSDVSDVQIDDEITINEQLYKVTGVVNIQQRNKVGDVSLEVYNEI